MKNKSNKISNKITFTILLASLISVWMTNFLYSFVIPQTLLMETIERSAFYKRTFLLTITIGSIAVLLVYLFYRRIEKAIKTIEKGDQILKDEFENVEKAFKNIETFLFLIGALSYILAVIINITIEILSKRGLDYKYWSFRTILAISFGILNGIVVARVINYAWIDAKNALNIHYLKEKEFKIKTNKKLIIPILMLSFVNISFFCVAIFNFFDRYAFTFIKFSFMFKHFILLFLKFIIVDFIILFAIILEHQKHIDHLYKQFDIMANLEMDLSKRVNIVSFDEIGMMISNINVVLKKLQDSFITIARAEKEVSDLSVDTQNAFKSLKEESDKLSMLIKEVQKIEDNESKIVEKANNDFMSLIIAIENTVSKYKYQSDSVEKTSISMKNILNSFQVTSRLMIETDHLFESLASNIYKGEDQVNLLTSVNKKMIESNSKIQEITKLILDISERSSLLAMNAAIEAAHAGESGVGFSVVAEEMRKLSESTSDSAQQIELIVKEMMDSNKEAEESNILIEKLFSQIHDELSQTSSKMKMVTKNAEEQTSLIDANITEVENLITINEEIKETTEKIIQIQPTVIHSLKELQNITKSLLENNNIMIDSVSKMNDSANIASLSFTKMIDSIGNLKHIISNYKIEASDTDSLKIDNSNKELRLTEL